MGRPIPGCLSEFFLQYTLAIIKGVVCTMFAMLLLHEQVYAQAICGFDQVNTLLQKANPDVRSRMLLNEQRIKTLIQQRKNNGLLQKREGATIYTIPVVVHVLHTGEPIGTIYNPTEEKITKAIEYLNEIYSGTSPTLTPEGTDAAGDIGLRFVLAKRDPDCNPTNGIDRMDMSSNVDYMANGASSTDISRDLTLKEPIIWDKSEYYNIYIVHKINGQDGSAGPFIAGYAYFPTSSAIDGTVMLATQMKAGSKTLVHEIGHAFYLYHPFEGSYHQNECPVGEGDMVADTDPISHNINSSGVINFTCRSGANKCNNNAPYSIRTENNFMNYTNCYTLFTPGQKDRIQSCLLLDERHSLTISSGATPTFENNACAPKINFAEDSATLDRTAVTSTGCRRYSDYTFDLTIGNSPVKDALVRIITDPASSAKEGVDYSFPSGKNVLFPLGNHDNQSFVIRIFSNEQVLQSKKLRLFFSIDNGGGNAVKGTAAPDMHLLINPNDASPVIPGNPGNVQIGVYNESVSNIKMFDASIRNQKIQILYKASELQYAGIGKGGIKGISFFVEKQTNTSFRNIYFKIGHTALQELVNNGQINISNNASQVLALPSYNTLSGWNTFTFTTPFIWNGTDNVVLEICADNGSSTGVGYDLVRAYSNDEPESVGNMILGAGTGCGQSFSSVAYYSNGVKPLVRLDYTQPGNPVQNTVTTSVTEYLGPYSEVYFYDYSFPKKIIGKIKNLTDWKYGCVNIKIDRSGDDVKPFWNQTQFLAQKTFFVSPEHNNPNGKYELTLYYTNAEKMGYETGTGKSWTNVRMIKTVGPVNDISPQNPQPASVEIVPVKIGGKFGDSYTVTGEFNTGFSGFGIGFIDAALPVAWLDVNAVPVNGNVLVKWQTAMEQNNHYFEVEVSQDAVHFTALSKIYAKGDAVVTTSYEYLHLHPPPGKIYYKIKQVDKDGTQSYSRIIFVTQGLSGEVKPTLYPVPARDKITINFGSNVLNPVVEILSSDMKPVIQFKKSGRVSAETINTGNMTAGAYFARINFEGKSYVLRFVKYQ